MDRYGSGVYFAAFLVLLLLVFDRALAQTFTYETVRSPSGTYTPNGVTTPTTVKFTPPGAGVPRYQQIVPTAPKGVISNFARNALRGGPAGWAAAAAVGAIVEGAGYLIDSATGEIKKVEETVILDPSQASCTIPNTCVQTVSARNNYCGNAGPGQHVNDGGGQFSAFRNKSSCQYAYPYTYDYREWNCVNPNYPIGQSGNWDTAMRCFSSEIEFITETEIIDLDPSDWEVLEDAWWAGLSPSQKAALAQWAITNASPRGSVDTANYPVTVDSANTQVAQLYEDYPEFRTALQTALNAEIALWLSTQTELELTPEQQEQIDQGTLTPPIPVETGPGEGLSELPAFCQWAEWVCRPFVSTDHPDVPEVEIDLEEYDSGLPSVGSCPAPVQLDLGMWGQHEISYQPICDFAELIRMFVIAIAYLLSGYIIVGVRR